VPSGSPSGLLEFFSATKKASHRFSGEDAFVRVPLSRETCRSTLRVRSYVIFDVCFAEPVPILKYAAFQRFARTYGCPERVNAAPICGSLRCHGAGSPGSFRGRSVDRGWPAFLKSCPCADLVSYLRGAWSRWLRNTAKALVPVSPPTAAQRNPRGGSRINECKARSAAPGPHHQRPHSQQSQDPPGWFSPALLVALPGRLAATPSQIPRPAYPVRLGRRVAGAFLPPTASTWP